MARRVIEHPILGPLPPAREVDIEIDGRIIAAREGEPIAAALAAAGIGAMHYTHKHNRPRGIFCAVGRCQDCVMIVDGIPNTRTCITPVRDQMKIQTQHGAGAWET